MDNPWTGPCWKPAGRVPGEGPCGDPLFRQEQRMYLELVKLEQFFCLTLLIWPHRMLWRCTAPGCMWFPGPSWTGLVLPCHFTTCFIPSSSPSQWHSAYLVPSYPLCLIYWLYFTYVGVCLHVWLWLPEFLMCPPFPSLGKTAELVQVPRGVPPHLAILIATLEACRQSYSSWAVLPAPACRYPFRPWTF